MTKPVVILGLSGGHDANWCVARDGVLLGAFEKERFTRRKHDMGEVLSLVEPSLRFLGITPADITIVATSAPVYRGTGPGHRQIAGNPYLRLDDWQWQTAECFGRDIRCVSVPHHLAHAAYARYSSGFDSTAVITWDGGGDCHAPNAYACTTASSWRGNRLEWIERLENSDFGSLWSVYSRKVFGDRHAAGKLMGLAAFGSEKLVASVATRFLAPAAGVLPNAITVADVWSGADIESPPFLEHGTHWELPVVRDLARGLQAVTTQAGVSIARSLQRLTGHTRLAMAGGVALNGYLNTAIHQEAGFEEVFVPPAVHDGGIAVGCALFAAHHALGCPMETSITPRWDFVGMAYDRDAVARAIAESGIEATPIEREHAESLIAGALAAGEIVGWYEGRSEHGPRALGNRSILASAANEEIRERLNREIKFREPFRPVAPVVPAGVMRRYFDLLFESPYMMFIVEATPEMRRSAPAAVHADGTSRVQTVSEASSLGRIASELGRRTGVPILINTSFNVQAPIVETPRDAIETFMKVPLSLLYLEGWLLRRTV